MARLTTEQVRAETQRLHSELVAARDGRERLTDAEVDAVARAFLPADLAATTQRPNNGG